MIAYYSIITVLALINLIILIAAFEGKKISYYFSILTFLMAIACAGYLALALSSTLPEAILASKITYIGGCFIPPVVLFAICTICNYKVPRWVRAILYAYSLFVYLMVLTVGYSPLYYSDAYLTSFGGATVLTHEYGVGHYFFYIIPYGYMLAEIAILIYTWNKNHAVSRKSLRVMIAFECANIVVFLCGRIVNSSVEIIPLMYVIDGWILLYLHHRAVMYNIEDSIVSTLGKQEYYGYIMFDNNRNYLGCNSVVENIFPSIKQCKIDKPLNNTAELNTINSWIDAYARGAKSVPSYTCGSKHYQCKMERIWHKEKAYGYIIELQEDTDRWNYMFLLSSYNAELEDQVKQKTEHIVNIQSQILVGMANIVENRDGDTGGHIRRTSHVIRILIETIQKYQLLPLSDEFCQDIIKAAPMHDLGKISIDDDILKKPGRLTKEEFAIIQTHAEKSAVLVESLLKDVEEEHFVKVATNIAHFHHEKWDGSGYPMHLKGDEIPIEARIMALADVYDALVSKRCYKEAMSFPQAHEVIESSMGSHFDPQLERVFKLSREKLEEYYSETDDDIKTA